MKNDLNSAFKSLTIVLTIALFCLGCKKKERSSTDWAELATAKMSEITALTANIPCSQQADVSIQEIPLDCSTNYYPVKTSDKSKFEKLKKEYLDLLSAQSKAMYNEGYIVEPCFESIWISEQAIRLECKSGAVQVITSANLSIEEAKPLAAKTYEEIMAIVNAQVCTNASAWGFTPLIKDRLMDVDFITYLAVENYTAFKKKVSLYNRLKARIIQAEGPADVVKPQMQVEKIECVNNKPVIKLIKL
ncbi:hypothetical protein [Pedobacter sp. MC2016-24]|uniref:hypothetical protein n=1 Tax=Pedobacter sp. MC2016-24 TaxID=2780090 RepID=UPI001882DEEB|nr:hypothetical protein [Pedobacter sp. MC2016-24]MBE9598596.1 hypothetical protein [Pedobacter sp. MC2016-24]